MGYGEFVPIPANGFGARACYTGSTGPLDYPGPAENWLTHGAALEDGMLGPACRYRDCGRT